MAQDELTQPLGVRLATLEQENARLRTELDACQRSLTRSTRSEQLGNAYAVLQAEVAAYRRQKQEWQEQAIIAREQEKAAQDRVAELENRNRLLESPESSKETRRERLLEATAAATNALLTVENLDEAVNTALQIIGESLDTDRVCVIENSPCPSESLPCWRILYEWDSPHAVSQIAHPELTQGTYEGIEAWYELLSQGQGISCLLEEMPEPFRSGQAALGLKALHIVPIFVEGQYWGEIGFDDCGEAKRRSPAELAVIKIAANCVGSAIQRDRIQRASEAAERQVLFEREQAAQERAAELERVNIELQKVIALLTESEERYRTLFELSSEGIMRWTMDPPMSITLPIEEQIERYFSMSIAEANAACLATYGCEKPEDFIGTKLSDIWVADSEMNRAMVRNHINNGYRLRNAETEEVDRNGRRLYLLNNTVDIIRDGCVVGAWCTSVDLTELRQTQQALLRVEQDRIKELARANNALQTTVAALADRRDLSGFIGEVLHTIAREFESPLVEYWQHLNSDTVEVDTWICANQLLSLKQGDEHPSRGGIRLQQELINFADVCRQPLVADEPMPAYSLASGQIICPTDWYAARGVSKHFNFPLQVGNSTVGSISVWLPVDRQITEDCLRLGQALSHQTALAIQLTQLAEEAKQAALAKLNEVVAREQEKAALERAAELESVNAVLREGVRQLSDESDIEAFLGYVLREIAQQSGASFVQLFRYNREENTLALHCTYREGRLRKGLSDEELSLFAAPFSADITPAFRIMCGSREVCTPQHTYDIPVEEFAWPGALEWLQREQISDGSHMVLFIGDTPIGTLAINFKDGRKLRPEDFPLVMSLSQQAAVALRLCEAAEQSRQAAIALEQEKAAQERVAELYKANTALKNSLDRLARDSELDAFLGHVILEIKHQLSADLAYLFLYDSTSHTLNLHSGAEKDWVLPKDQLQDIAPFLEPIPADVTRAWELMVQAKKPIEFGMWENEHPENWPGTTKWHRSRGHLNAMVMPLILGDQGLGFLGLAFMEKSTFTPEEFELAQSLAHQATLAIQLTTLAEKAKQAAIAREQEKAAQEREKAAQQQAVELTRANTLLRNSLGRLSTNPDLKDVLGHLLVEVVRYAGASVGHIFSYDAAQNTLTMNVRCRNEQAFWTPADDEPIIFQSPISVETTPIFSHLCDQPRLITLNHDEFEGRMWPTLLNWFQAKAYQATSCCVLMVGDRPFGMLAMAFPQQIALLPVDEELILALAQQIALVLQLTTLVEADKQAVIACEREKAAQGRVSELAKANQSLQRSLNRLADDSDLDSFLGHILVEITHQVGADTGHIFLHDSATNTLELRQGVLHGEPYQTANDQDADLFQAPFSADLSPAFQYFCQQRIIELINREDLGELAWTGGLDWLRQQDYHQIAALALMAGDQPIGLLALAFRNKPALKPEERCLIHALAHQATLAIQLTRLAEQAKESAIFEERNRLAGEIHDTLAQAFTGISIQLGVAKWLVQQDPVAVDQILDRVSELAQTGLAEARRSVWTLYPTDAAYADLAHQLSRCVEQMTSGTPMQVDVQIFGTPCSLPPMVGKNLLRIGQEAITNALKHAQASTLQICLTYTDESIRLCIRDDGRGFLPNVDRSGFGLISMSDRADRMGGQLIINSQPEQGTAICIQVPLK